MKKTLKISAIVIGALLLLLIVTPLLFRSKIREQVQNEINKNLNATVSFESVRLSLIRHFPAMTLNLNGLTITGTDEFKEDTLAGIPQLSITLDLVSVIRGEDYKVRKIILNSPRLLLKVLSNGKVNWDITKPSEPSDTTSAPSAFKVMLDKVILRDASLTYDDAETPMLFAVHGLSGELSGDMTSDITNLVLDATAKELVTDYDGVRYIAHAQASVNALLQADLKNWKFTFKDATLRLNELEMDADGFFAMPDDGYDMDISFISRNSSFRSILSLVPAVYSNEFASVKTDGSLSFKGFVRGKYSETSMPAFGIDLVVGNGRFSYPALPAAVADVQINASVSNPDGIPDNTLVNVGKLHLKMADNPVDISFILQNPVSDPYIRGTIKGNLDLSGVKAFYPLEKDTRLEGSVNADITLDGRISSLENGRYQEFKAAGFVTAGKVYLSSPQIPQPVEVKSARMEFTPAYIALTGLEMLIGKNDLSANGKLENYLPYFLKENALLRGGLNVSSGHMDLNSLITGLPPAEGTADTTALTIVEIPGNMDLSLQASLKELIYDKYRILNANGLIRVKDKTLYLDGLNLEMLGGGMSLKGMYSTFNPGSPDVDMAFRLSSINVKDAFRTFSTMQAFAPVAGQLKGNISTNLSFKGKLKENMMPELASLSGAGLLLSDILTVENLNTFNVIADVLKIDKLRNPAIEKVNLSFDLVDGIATVKPMDFKLGSYKSVFSGTIGLDQAINFVLNMDIPRSDFGGKANGVLNGMVSEASGKGIPVKLGETVPVTLLIGGTITDPKITAGIRQAMAGLVEDIKQQAVAQVQQKKEEVVARAKEEAGKWIEQADEQAQKILALARQQSDQILNSAKLGADKIRSQADSSGNQLIAEGKKNGMIAELAAKKASDKLKKEADSKAVKLLDEARVKSAAILKKAEDEAARVREQAKNRVK